MLRFTGSTRLKTNRSFPCAKGKQGDGQTGGANPHGVKSMSLSSPHPPPPPPPAMCLQTGIILMHSVHLQKEAQPEGTNTWNRASSEHPLLEEKRNMVLDLAARLPPLHFSSRPPPGWHPVLLTSLDQCGGMRGAFEDGKECQDNGMTRTLLRIGFFTKSKSNPFSTMD